MRESELDAMLAATNGIPVEAARGAGTPMFTSPGRVMIAPYRLCFQSSAGADSTDRPVGGAGR